MEWVPCLRRNMKMLRRARDDAIAKPRFGVHVMRRKAVAQAAQVSGRCLCGAVTLEIDYPAWWAWHDHTRASRIAHGAAYATYVGIWRKHFRIVKGEGEIARYEDAATRTARSFCARCGTPLLYE